jgi:hypothetical protein
MPAPAVCHLTLTQAQEWRENQDFSEAKHALRPISRLASSQSSSQRQHERGLTPQHSKAGRLVALLDENCASHSSLSIYVARANTIKHQDCFHAPSLTQ